MWGWVSAGTAVLMLVSALVYQDWRIDNLKAKAAGYKNAISTLSDALEAHKVAISECERISQENFDEAEAQRALVNDASERIEALRERYNQEVEEIENERTDILNAVQGDCPAANDPGFVDWLLDGS